MITLTPRILREAKTQAALLANRIRTAVQRGQVKSWTDIESQFKITVPDTWKNKPFTWGNLGANSGSFCQFWELSFQARLQAETSKEPETKVLVDKNVSTFGEVTLFPEQQGVFKAIHKALLIDHEQAILNDGATGSGKTILASALIAQAYQDGIFNTPEMQLRLHHVAIFCPKGVAEHWRREITRCGLYKYLKTRKILIFPDSDFSANHSSMYVDEHEDFNTGNITVKWNPLLVPYLNIVDEYHRYVNKNSWRTMALEALVKAKPVKHFLTMSATPMEKVNDAYLFTMMCNKTFMGVHVNEDTFKQFSQLIDPRPDKPNREALKRLRSVLSKNIISIPYVKPKHKAINVVWLVDFWKPEHKAIYQSAHERYIEACSKSGRNTAWGRFEAFIALNNFRKTAEPLRAHQMAFRITENYKSGTLATAVGAAYKETITEIAFLLVDKYNIPRSEISVIWGGKKEYKPEDLLSKEQLDAILKNPDILSLSRNKGLMKKVRTTIRYIQDKHEHSESVEEQAYRHNKLKELKLVGKQSDNTRQIEIDNFQDGTSKVCLFTIASGGVGLSFDRNKESLLRREGLFTPVYSGKEYQQVLGRLVRRASIDDAIQRTCLLAGTVEEYHVLPILDNKLKCIAEITNRNLDMVELLANRGIPSNYIPRDIDTAVRDAENDNTIVTDFVAKGDDDDDDADEETEVI